MCKYTILILALVTMLCSCQYVKKSADIYDLIYEEYKFIKSYQSKITMKITSNKTIKEYKMNQYYKYPNKYRLDVIEPDEIKGLVTYYSGSGVSMVYPEVGGKFTLMDYTPVDKTYIFIPDFFSAYYKSEQTSVYTINMDKNRYTILKTSIAGLNMYRNSESLWIDNKTFLPAKLLVYDLKGNAVITVIFETIKLNTEINDMIFEVGG